MRVIALVVALCAFVSDCFFIAVDLGHGRVGLAALTAALALEALAIAGVVLVSLWLDP